MFCKSSLIGFKIDLLTLEPPLNSKVNFCLSEFQEKFVACFLNCIRQNEHLHCVTFITVFPTFQGYMDNFSRALHLEYSGRGIFIQSLIPFQVIAWCGLSSTCLTSLPVLVPQSVEILQLLFQFSALLEIFIENVPIVHSFIHKTPRIVACVCIVWIFFSQPSHCLHILTFNLFFLQCTLFMYVFLLKLFD